MPERQPSVALRISLFALLVLLLSPLAALFVLMVASPAFAQVAADGFGALAVAMAVAGIMLARRLFSPHWRPPPGPSDSRWWRRRWLRSAGADGSAGAPRGGIPMPDAEQSRERLRDHDRPERRRLRPRRPAREPDRTPAPGAGA